MKVLLINGSPHANGNTTIALRQMEHVFSAQRVEYEEVRVGSMPVRGCIACGHCSAAGTCVFDDAVNELLPKFAAADGLVVATPVYYGSANATLVATLDRLFYASNFDKTMKVGASVAIARRGGTEATFDELNKYFTISGMPVASGYYWNNVFGLTPGESEGDEEGLRNMRNLARNMVFLMRSIQLGCERYGMPERESGPGTNFIR